MHLHQFGEALAGVKVMNKAIGLGTFARRSITPEAFIGVSLPANDDISSRECSFMK